MGVAVVMERPETQAVPGQRSSSDVRIRNTGAVVDEIELDVTGDAAGWAHVEPPSVNLMPGEEGTARIVFTPPRSSQVAEGLVHYAFRAMSREDTEGSAVHEAVVEIAPYSAFSGEMLPRTSTGRRTATHQLCLDNLGNHPELISIDASDPDLKLDFTIDPANVSLAPGTATFVKIKVKPKRTFFRGPNQTIPFQVAATPAQGEPIFLQGNMLQRSLLPAGFFTILALVLAGLIALVVLWYTWLKPEIEATARSEAQEELAAVDKKATDAAATAEEAQEDSAAAEEQSAGAAKQANQAEKKAEQADKKVTTATSGGLGGDGGGTTSTLDKGKAVDRRVAVEAAPGEVARREFAPDEENQTLWVTDLLLQNPAGDSGTLRIQRGDTTLLTFGLQNFRDQDYHLIQPAQFTSEEPVAVEVTCRNDSDPCTPSVYLGGQIVTPKRGDG
jgi:hypothetical protein